MNVRLTCWKEIADYFGKDVRTVQRWESQLGMPIRRPSPNIVIAVPKDLDEWIAKMPRNNGRLCRQIPANESAEPLEASNDVAYCAFDREFRYLHASERACQLIDRKLREIVGRSVWKVHPELERLPLGELFITSLRNKKYTPTRIDSVREEDGRHFRIIVLASEHGIETFWRDVTEEKLAAMKKTG
jgi:PAS domain S-box-containing protein